ncbi:MAG TPA: hypothetical protein VJU86_17440 [Pyrinomonadaceae bacterium]|nr:hypothetical protein [Pyrinomonadaceae bacterium]
MPEAEFEITELGAAVLADAQDFIQLNGIDLWLGGVHLDGANTVWRWDESRQRVISCNAV